jgi:hypothetical protein
VIFLGRKSLTEFDMEKDVRYYQDKIYINRQDSNTLYDELKEFRQSLSKEENDTFFIDCFNDLLTERQDDDEARTPTGEIRTEDSKGMSVRPDDLNSGGFFDEKLKVLKDEIEDINRNLEERKKIEKISTDSIDSEIDEVKRQLHEIYTWKKGEKQTIEFIRMEFIKHLTALYREKRSNSLNLWKDSVFEKRDRRNLLLEYKSLCWTDELAFEKKTGGKKKS